MANNRPIDEDRSVALRIAATHTRPRSVGSAALLALAVVGLAAAPMVAAAAALDDDSLLDSDSDGNVTGLCSPTNLTVPDVLKLASLIRDRIYCRNNATDEEGVRYHPLIPGTVRLAFHSSIDRRLRGCINLNDQRQASLRFTVDELEQLYHLALSDPYYAKVSRADFWALAGIVGVEVATRGALSIEFRYGRCDDCPTGSYATNELIDLPDIAQAGDASIAYLQRVFSINFYEAVALMGAHSLGFVTDAGAIIDKWTPNPELLGSGYFASMTNAASGWRQSAHHYSLFNRTVWSWTHADGKRIYLNADMGMYKALRLANNESGLSACGWLNCSKARSSATVAFYARDQQGFFFYFASAFKAMLESGLSGILRKPLAAPSTAA